jgi:hypothetical protein
MPLGRLPISTRSWWPEMTVILTPLVESQAKGTMTVHAWKPWIPSKSDSASYGVRLFA